MTDKFAATSAVGLVLFQEEGEEADGLYHWLVVRSVSVVGDDLQGQARSLSLSLVLPLTSPFIPLQHVGRHPRRWPVSLGSGGRLRCCCRCRVEAGRAVGGHDWSSSDELTIRRTGISCFCLPQAGA